MAGFDEFDGFDYESFRTSQAEVLKKTFPVRLGSEKVTTDEDGNDCEPYERDVILQFPHHRDWPLAAQLKAGQQDLLGFVAELIGEDGLQRLLDYGWTFGDLEDLMDAMAKWSGFKPGQTSSPPPGRGSIPGSN